MGTCARNALLVSRVPPAMPALSQIEIILKGFLAEEPLTVHYTPRSAKR